MSDIDDRLTEYCLHGGLYNPELMQHEKVRDLLIDCRSEIDRLRLTNAEREAIERAIETLDGWQKTGGYHSAIEDDAAALRGLLERTQ